MLSFEKRRPFCEAGDQGCSYRDNGHDQQRRKEMGGYRHEGNTGGDDRFSCALHLQEKTVSFGSERGTLCTLTKYGVTGGTAPEIIVPDTVAGEHVLFAKGVGNRPMM